MTVVGYNEDGFIMNPPFEEMGNTKAFQFLARIKQDAYVVLNVNDEPYLLKL